MARSSKYVRAKTLPPTAAAMTHSSSFSPNISEEGNYRQSETTESCEWGRKNVDGHMVAMQPDLLPASKKLIQVFRCDCKTGYHTARCTCKRHGLNSSSLCGECKGQSCSNATKRIPMDDVPDDD